MGWGPETFWACTPAYFSLAYAGWIEAETAREENNLWRTRWATFYGQPMYVTNKSGLTPQSMLPLPSDKAAAPKQPEITPEQRAELFRKIDEAIMGQSANTNT